MIWLTRSVDKRWFSSRDDCRNDDGGGRGEGVESILMAKVVRFVLEAPFPILYIVTIATEYVADAYYPKEALYQICNQYQLRQRSY